MAKKSHKSAASEPLGENGSTLHPALTIQQKDRLLEALSSPQYRDSYIVRFNDKNDQETIEIHMGIRFYPPPLPPVSGGKICELILDPVNATFFIHRDPKGYKKIPVETRNQFEAVVNEVVGQVEKEQLQAILEAQSRALEDFRAQTQSQTASRHILELYSSISLNGNVVDIDQTRGLMDGTTVYAAWQKQPGSEEYDLYLIQGSHEEKFLRCAQQIATALDTTTRAKPENIERGVKDRIKDLVDDETVCKACYTDGDAQQTVFYDLIDPAKPRVLAVFSDDYDGPGHLNREALRGHGIDVPNAQTGSHDINSADAADSTSGNKGNNAELIGAAMLGAAAIGSAWAASRQKNETPESQAEGGQGEPRSNGFRKVLQVSAAVLGVVASGILLDRLFGSPVFNAITTRGR